MEFSLNKIDLSAASIVRTARANKYITVAGLQDELERGDIEGWDKVVQRYALTFSEWSGAMQRAIAILSK